MPTEEDKKNLAFMLGLLFGLFLFGLYLTEYN